MPEIERPHPEFVGRILSAYPRIYFACHTRHVQDPESDGTLSRHQASILSHLDEVDPTRVGELAEHMGVTDSTMSLSVKRLVRQGYLRRSRNPDDRRVVELRLTAAGVRVKEAQSVLDADRVAALVEHLPPEEREPAVRGLERLAEAGTEAIRSGAMEEAAA